MKLGNLVFAIIVIIMLSVNLYYILKEEPKTKHGFAIIVNQEPNRYKKALRKHIDRDWEKFLNSDSIVVK